jgi:capsular exopolysaccharide synthesis family protein
MSRNFSHKTKPSAEVQEQVEIDLRKFLLIITRYWLPALIGFSLIAMPVTLFAWLRRPSYRATGSVLVKRQMPANSVLGLQVDVGEIEALDKTGPITTQAEIVKSVPIMQRTIKDLNLVADDGTPLATTAFSKKLKVSPIPRSDLLKIEYSSDDPLKAAEVVNHVIHLYVDDNLTANRAEAKAAREFIQNQLPQVEKNVRQAEQDIRRFKENNQIVALNEEQNTSVEVTADSNKRISETRSRLAGITSRTRALRQKVGEDSQLASIHLALSQSRGIQETLKQAQNLQDQQAVALGRYRPDHPKVQELQRQINETKLLLRSRTSDIAGKVIRSDTDIENLQLGAFREQLITELAMSELEQSNLEQQVQSLNASQTSHQGRANNLPRLATIDADLGRRLKAAQATYEMLLSKLQEIQVAEKQQLGNARTVSSAIIPEKSSLLTSPVGRVLISIAGIITGLLVASGTSLVAYLLDQRIRSVQDLKDIFKYPVLGIIPSFTDTGVSQMMELLTKTFQKSLVRINGIESELVVRDVPRSAAATAYRMLHTNLKFISSDRRAKAIVITSCVQREGKSIVSANLATVLAQLGQRVLLVDADLRHSRQHHIWNLENSHIGFSNILIGVASLEQALCPVMENLSVIPAGTLPPNPVPLLDSEQMANLVQEFSRQFDYVIFDTPPLSGISDALILGKLTDGIVLVSRMGAVNFSSAQNAKEYLGQAEQKVLGLVINDVNPKDEPDSYFYGAYPYGYDMESNNGSSNGSSNGAVSRRFIPPQNRQ